MLQHLHVVDILGVDTLALYLLLLRTLGGRPRTRSRGDDRPGLEFGRLSLWLGDRALELGEGAADLLLGQLLLQGWSACFVDVLRFEISDLECLLLEVMLRGRC